jgi:6-phosphofructokinase 1
VYACLERVLARKGHAVVVVAEGAAQELIADQVLAEARDKSGNARLKDVGVFLRDRIVAHFGARGREATVKYIDPSYTIRSVPACRRTASIAGTWRAMRCMRRWPATPAC